MKKIIPILGISLMAAGTLMATTNTIAADETSEIAASQYHFLVGDWKGKGTAGAPDEEPEHMTVTFTCQKEMNGWAVSCVVAGTRPDGKTTMEASMFGVDTITGQGHWYGVNNLGEAHDFLTSWPDPKTLQGQAVWADGGKTIYQISTIKQTGDNHLVFQDIVTADGVKVFEIAGELKR